VRKTIVNNYKDILKSKNTIFTIIVVAGFGLLAGLVIHQERVQAERGNIALIKQQQNQQDVEQVRNAIKDFTTADKVTNHYSEKALKLDIKDSDSQFQDKQKLEAAITSLQKILGIITNINSANGQTSIEEKTKPIQELISKFKKQVETLTKKEEQKETETTSSVQGVEANNSEDRNYTPIYTESSGSINNSQAPAVEHYSSDSASNAGNQAADSSGSQAESNSHSD